MNRYWRTWRGRTLISQEGRTFRKSVCALLAGGGPRKPPAGGRIALAMDAFPPDRRQRDLDNILKATLDALEHGRVYADDSQIDLLVVRRGEQVPGGRVIVKLYDLPTLKTCPLCGAPEVV